MYSEPEMISIDSDNGSLEGYKISSTAEQLQNWFAERGFEAPTYNTPVTVGFLNSLYVDEDARSNGEGTFLVESFLSECGECDYIFLECDTAEQNEFNLQKWYESFGFEVLVEAECPILILSQD
ncbi:GNAT family N-acetyltransferase [Shigella flexneri]